MADVKSLKKFTENYFTGELSYNGDVRAASEKQLIKMVAALFSQEEMQLVEMGPGVTAYGVLQTLKKPGGIRVSKVLPLRFNTNGFFAKSAEHTANFSNLTDILDAELGSAVAYCEASRKGVLMVGIACRYDDLPNILAQIRQGPGTRLLMLLDTARPCVFTELDNILVR